jgi:hypothetical protein
VETVENIFNNVINTTTINNIILDSLTQILTGSESTFQLVITNPNDNTPLTDNVQITIPNETVETLNNVLTNQVSEV